ncbi:DNA-directed RNA polymerase subunit beta', partial [Candidatus Roizmanbacteria bacterium CG10_big_fil_rev_8_21_14_0_10_39_6]
LIAKGYQLSEGYLKLKEVLEIKGMRAAQLYLLHEVQNVYESQGIGIHDKHFEVIIKKMSDKTIVEDEGDTGLLVGEVVNKDGLIAENKKVVAKGGKPASGKATIMGVTRAAVQTDSWLSAASFQNTTTVLTSAAIRGQVDYLYGLKENVIIGRLIPVTKELIDTYYG